MDSAPLLGTQSASCVAWQMNPVAVSTNTANRVAGKEPPCQRSFCEEDVHVQNALGQVLVGNVLEGYQLMSPFSGCAGVGAHTIATHSSEISRMFAIS